MAGRVQGKAEQARGKTRGMCRARLMRGVGRCQGKCGARLSEHGVTGGGAGRSRGGRRAGSGRPGRVQGRGLDWERGRRWRRAQGR